MIPIVDQDSLAQIRHSMLASGESMVGVVAKTRPLQPERPLSLMPQELANPVVER